MVLQKWNSLIDTALHPVDGSNLMEGDDAVENFVVQVKVESELLKNYLIEGVIDRKKLTDKKEFVHVIQAMLIQLLDKLHFNKEVSVSATRLGSLYSILFKHLEEALKFTEDFFGNYSDGELKVPAIHLLVSIGELRKQLEEFQEVVKLNGAVDAVLVEFLVNQFQSFCSNTSQEPTYTELRYQREVMNGLLADVHSTNSSIIKLLFYFNFNHDDLVSFLLEKNKTLIETSDSNNEKIAALLYEQKNINQLRTKLNCSYSPYMPSLKDQVNNWIEEEIKYLKIDPVYASSVKGDNEVVSKIQTSLSVPRLALLIRLMVVDKVITNRVVAQVLRIVIKTVATTQSDNIGFGSIESKYHTPDKGTITAVKDLLFRWINILNEL